MKCMLYLSLFISIVCAGSEGQNRIKRQPSSRSVYVNNQTPFCIDAYIRGSIQSSAPQQYREISGRTEIIPACGGRTLHITHENPLYAAVVVVCNHYGKAEVTSLSGIEKMESPSISVEYKDGFYLSILQ
jgi:hypothetical protein